MRTDDAISTLDRLQDQCCMLMYVYIYIVIRKLGVLYYCFRLFLHFVLIALTEKTFKGDDFQRKDFLRGKASQVYGP